MNNETKSAGAVNIPDSIASLDPSCLYWWGNADELHAGDKVLLADSVGLIPSVEPQTLQAVLTNKYNFRFRGEPGGVYMFAYLLSRKKTPVYRPWKVLPRSVKAGSVLLDATASNIGYLVLAVDYHYSEESVCLIDWGWISLESLFNGYTQEDGTPCGEIIPEGENE
jgi:hypothetical protein